MGTQRVDLRVEQELVEWADAYASDRGVTRTALFESALVSFREDAEAGVPELRRAAAAQAARSGALEALQGVGDCPERPGELGHIFKAPSKDPERACSFCGLKGRAAHDPSKAEQEGFFAQATAERTELFSGLRTPDSIANRKPKS